MRRVVAVAALFTLLPVGTAAAADLDELLDRSQEASYSAEQVITCSTPEGVRDAVVSLEQVGGELQVSGEVEVSSGSGGWALVREGSVVDSASVEAGSSDTDPAYRVDDGSAHPFLNRKAGLYRLYAGDVLRGELIVDGATGALLSVITYNGDGDVYCERRFIEFDPTPPEVSPATVIASETLEPTEDTAALPESLGAFQRLDVYSDDEGLTFAYYSDGFFSFAVFRTPTVVELTDPGALTIGQAVYARSFAPGQVTYSWETRHGGMALVGDLPPDMHTAVLERLAKPFAPGILQRVWRNLFG
ncbi:MAG TPA: hypothetical protein VI980_08060 [Acidimicrobiia bacterium]|nr:hypothetical protein [Acidimicrobiia bacterium]